MNKTLSYWSRRILFGAALCFSFLITSPQVSARILDGGVDPENLGKGDWIWSVSISISKLNNQVPGVTDIPSLMSWEKNQGMSFVIVKAGTGSTNYPSQASPQFTSNLVYQAHLQGLKIFAYTRSYGDDINGEIAMATNCFNLGADGFVFDAETEWESGHQGTQGPAKAIQMLSAVRTMYPNKFLAHAPLPYISLHSSFPYKEFGFYCDAVMPQDYWNYIGVTPEQMVADMDTQWRNFYNGLTGQWTNAIKPLAPIGQADITNVPNAEITAFANAVVNDTNAVLGPYKGMSWWDAHQHSTTQWVAIGAITIGDPPAVPDIIVDNPAATMVGSWSLASSSADKYGTDYRFKSGGTGAAYLQYFPNVVTPGTYKVYTMYPKGTNRTTNAPVVITYNGGSTTVRVNQQTLGGSWVYLGAYDFAAGTSGNIKIADNFTVTTNLVMADAIRLAYVPPPPAAPSDLTATAAAGPVINLNWTDNSTDESEFVVSRSATAGGPYTDISTVNGGVTTFTDTAVSSSTTYYYVVRAANAAGSSASSSEASATTGAEVADIIIDNPAATMAGSWSLGTGAPDKFGSDYRFKSQGTGAAFLNYAPNILTAGNYQVYEWHPQGSNRPLGAPHVITYNGGSTTINVNQQTGGGRWNLLGTFNFAAGSSGGVKISDAFNEAGQSIMADAIKFVYLPAPPTPATPSGLAATTISSSQINLNWIDNSSNEDNFVVASSTTSGGPYSDTATLPANTTSYSDAGLVANRTYYYVVRAVNGGGASANSAQATATTLPAAPATPTGLTATTVSQTEISLAWIDNSSNEDNFVVSRSSTAGGPYTDVVILGVGVTSYNDIGLSPDTAYYYVVRAINLGGSSPYSTEAGVMTLPVAPGAPSDLVATIVSQTQIDLSWTDNATNEDSVIVARSETAGGPYTDLATLAADATSYSDTNLTANTTYYYVVRASNIGGDSADSVEVSATTLPEAPGAPSGLAATTVSQTQINLSWTDNSSNEDNFIVGRSTTAGGSYADIATLGAGVTSFNDTGLTANTTYYYVVRTKNAGGESANSAEASATTLPVPPAAPTGLTAITVSASQIDLSWTDNASNESSFTVARSTTVGGPYTDIATLPANSMSYSDTGLSANTAYYYVVRASNAGGVSANTAEASATTLPLPPTAPSGLTATTVSQTQINLTWSDNSDNEVNFIVARSTTAGGPYTDIATLPANTTSYNNTGLTANTTYYYVVRASNTGGASANSNQASATTLPTAPAAPSNLSVLAYSSTQINLAWADNASNESSYIVARATTSGGPYTDVATLAANSTSYNDTGLSANTTYYYVVRASNAGGSSANSAQASTTTFETDLLIDNKSAIVIGSWSSGTASTDKYAADYRFKSGGTGAAYLQFTPYVATTAVYEVYEWHSQGSNRATNAPHIITFNGGAQTNVINQQVNGGKWNLLGSFSFAAGNAGNIKITDNFAGTNSVMADAIKLVAIPLPAAPSALAATAISGSQINLTWTDNATNETSIIVARSTTVGGPYTDVATLAANTTSYSNTGLTPNTTYYYVVRAVGVAGTSANSAEANARTFSAPAAPSALTATAANPSKIDLAWTDNSTNETAFVIGRSTVSGGPYTDIVTLAANVTTYSDATVSPNTTYYYVVRATNAIGSSANSGQASSKTPPMPPSPPGGLSATTASSSQINLTWTDNSPNEDNFILARSTTVGGPYTDIATLQPNTTSYSNTGLAANTTYYYVLRAVNGGGSSPNSNEASATTYPNAPVAPSALTATALSSSSIKLTWTDNSANETSFVVARSTVSGGPYTDVATLGANVTAYTNTALTLGTTYYYVVRAANAGGSSANSAQASATTLTAAPAAPSALTATALSSTSIKLTWTDNASNESNFVVARSTVSGGPYTDIATLAANTTGYTNTGLSGSTTYYYVVRATNAGGSSANTAQASATTLAVADIVIDNPAATVTGTWTTSTSATDKFGTDYRSRSQGTGANYLTYRPTVQVAGNYQVYEWHSAGTNRTTNAPVVISYNGGSRTNFVNQKVNGGTWIALGSPVNMATGTNGFVRITDKFSDAGQTVIADAIKLVYVP